MPTPTKLPPPVPLHDLIDSALILALVLVLLNMSHGGGL